MTPSFKLICTDLDRTFLNAQGQPSLQNANAIRQAVAVGYAFVVASGRRLPSIAALYQALGVRGDKIFFNGACIADADNQVIASTALAPAQLTTLMAIGQRFGLNLSLSALEAGFEYVPPTATWVPGYLNVLPHDLTALQTAVATTTIYKISFSGERPALEAAAAAVRAQTAVTCSWTDTHYLEMTAPGVNKLTGLQHLCAMRGINMAATVAFGDYENDAALLHGAGLGVAMSNALPQVQAAADQVVDNRAFDGVAQVVRTLLQ